MKTAFNQFLSNVKNHTYPNRIERRIPDQFATLNGVKIRCTHPLIVKGGALAVIRSGKYEEPELQLVAQSLTDGDIVLEIGGGCGYISSYIWKTRHAKKIHVVEASPDLIPVIKDTHRLNGVNAKVYHEIVGAEIGPRQFYVCDDFPSSSTEDPNGRAVTVQGRSWIDRVNEWKPSFVVMDIEGGEAEIIPLGMPDCIRRIVVEFHPAIFGLEKQYELIASLGAMGFTVSGQIGQVYSFARS